MKKNFALGPVLWGSLSFVLGAALASFIAFRELNYLAANPDIAADMPKVAPQFPVIYFFSAVVVIGIILLVIPVSKLKWVFKTLFIFLYAWGIFVVLAFTFQTQLTAITIISVLVGLVWFLWPRVWLQNILMLLALVGIGSVFGVLVKPWPIMIFLLVVAVYDYLAVRFGYMIWMANKLSKSDSLPAFVIPKTTSNWNHSLKTTGSDSQTIIEGDASQREYSILGGGDVGFPLILMVSVYANYGFGSSMIIAGFSLVGLIGAFVIQSLFLKGKPMPALPPIAISSLIGLLIVIYAIK
jgi:presenilin-like A22 family membrane protease